MPKCKKSDYILSGKIVGEMVGVRVWENCTLFV